MILITTKLTLAHIFALPYISVQHYLRNNQYPIQGQVVDRLFVTILLANQNLLVRFDHELLLLDKFKELYLLPDEKLIAQIKSEGKEVTNLTNRFDLIRILLGKIESEIVDAGQVYTFGSNSTGQLGLGDRDDRNITELLFDKKIITVSCGNEHTAIIDDKGQLYILLAIILMVN